MDLSRRRLLFSALALAGTHHGAQAAKAEPQRRPNIFYTTADDWSHGHAGAYGSKWVKTPVFDRIAREGVLFNNCFTSNPKCSPCRASILTGRNTWQLEEAANHWGIFPSKFSRLPRPIRGSRISDRIHRQGMGSRGLSSGWLQAKSRWPRICKVQPESSLPIHVVERLRAQL